MTYKLRGISYHKSNIHWTVSKNHIDEIISYKVIGQIADVSKTVKAYRADAKIVCYMF